MSLVLSTAATGVARDAHYVVPTGGTVPIRTLLLEPQRTNLCIRSEEFDTWTDSTTCNVTANSSTAPDGTLTADTLTATATGSTRYRAVTFTGNGEKCAALHLKAGTSARSLVSIGDSTTGVQRHRVQVAWNAGVPTLTTESGSGTIYPAEALGNGWYRILWSATGVIAANVNTVRVQPDSLAGTGTVLAWGAQAEDAVVPSSYIPTAGTTVTRNADSLYFPFTAPPQAMTVYVRGVERGTALSATETRLLAITADPLATASLRVDINASGFYRVRSVQTAGASESGMTTKPSVGDLAELRVTLSAAGVARIHQSINSATETSATAGLASALDGAWSGQRLYLNGVGTANNGLFAFTHVAVAAGEQTMATMRELAGVV